MAFYQYQALDSAGKAIKGTLEADSERQARQALRSKNLTPVIIRTLQHAADRGNGRHYALSRQALALFTRQLSVLVSAGVPLADALKSIVEQTEKPSARQLMTQVRSRLLEGYSLAQAMGKYPKAFPLLYRTTIAAGEQTGKFDTVLDKLALYTDNQQKMLQKIQQALIYPILMVIVSFSIVSFLLVFVVPKMVDVFTDSSEALPIMTVVLISISHAMHAYGLYGVLLAILAIVIFKQAMKRPNFVLKYHQTLLRLPGISHFLQVANTARYAHTFSILFSAGVSVLESMRVSTSLLANRFMQNRFQDAYQYVKEGLPVSQALAKTTFITPMVRHLIETGEKSGNLAGMMEHAGAHLDQEITRITDTMLTLLEPLIIIIMGLVVLFIVLATLLPIFSMQQLVM